MEECGALPSIYQRSASLTHEIIASVGRVPCFRGSARGAINVAQCHVQWLQDLSARRSGGGIVHAATAPEANELAAKSLQPGTMALTRHAQPSMANTGCCRCRFDLPCCKVQPALHSEENICVTLLVALASERFSDATEQPLVETLKKAMAIHSAATFRPQS